MISDGGNKKRGGGGVLRCGTQSKGNSKKIDVHVHMNIDERNFRSIHSSSS
jgi:hypothetical protein